MIQSSARVQACVVAGLAVVLGGTWLLFGTPIRVRWIVARGAPPAPDHASAKAVEEIRAMGDAARPVLVSILEDGGTARSRKSWVASVLLRTPWFDRAPVERALASPHKATARAAAFSLMGGEEFLVRGGSMGFDDSVAFVESSRTKAASRGATEGWDPAPAIPVLTAWIADAADPEASYAALLLGKIPPGDVRVRDALLAAVEEVPRILRAGTAAEQAQRKMVAVNALQSLLAWAREDAVTATRVAKVVAWISESGNSDFGWDIQQYGLKLFKVARGRGVDPGLLRALTKSGNPIVRQTLAHTLEDAAGAETGELLRELLADEVFAVRRAAIYTLRKRKDPLLLDMLPYLVEDAFIYCRSDVLKSVGELRGVAPERCAEAVPILVSCLEDPWPGPPMDPASPRALSFAADKADVVQGAALSLYMITFQCPGFVLPGKDGGKPELAILDNRKRAEIAAVLAADAEKRRAVVEEWRKTVKPWPEANRVPALVLRLEDRDPENVLRACRELARVTGESTAFPPAILERGGDDTVHRNSIRALRKSGEWQKVVEAWKAKK